MCNWIVYGAIYTRMTCLVGMHRMLLSVDFDLFYDNEYGVTEDTMSRRGKF